MDLYILSKKHPYNCSQIRAIVCIRVHAHINNHRYDKTVEDMDTSFKQECPVAVDKTTGEITRAAAKMKEYFLVRQQKEHIRL